MRDCLARRCFFGEFGIFRQGVDLLISGGSFSAIEVGGREFPFCDGLAYFGERHFDQGIVAAGDTVFVCHGDAGWRRWIDREAGSIAGEGCSARRIAGAEKAFEEAAARGADGIKLCDCVLQVAEGRMMVEQ